MRPRNHPLVDELFRAAAQRRMTMVELALRSNVDRKTLYSMKNQNKNAGLTTVDKIGKALGMELKWNKSI